MEATAGSKEQEQETVLIIYSADPVQVTHQLSSEVGVANYRFLPGDPDTIHIRDIYFDTSDHALEGQQLALRLRETNGKQQITLKGPGRAMAGGGEERLEIEASWSADALSRVIKELTERGVKLPGMRIESAHIQAIDVLTRLGLEKIQVRLCDRQIRNVAPKGRNSGPALAELDIDHVVYDFGGPDIGLYEVEIEAKQPGGTEALATISHRLVEIYAPALRPWEYSKLATGKAIKKLLDAGSLEGLLSPDRVLMPGAYDKIDALLKSGSV